MSDVSGFSYDLCVVGGCGRVGLPLALAFAAKGLKVAIYDLNESACALVRSGRMPFQERGADELLPQVLANLTLANDPQLVAQSKVVVVVIGTPVDEHLNPTFSSLIRLVRSLRPFWRSDQLLVLRSTLYPGTTEQVAHYFASENLATLISFCPERIAEGKALEELESLPQIVSGTTPEALQTASDFFMKLAPEVLALSTFEAELAKLFTNSWRYLQFAAANQFYMMAQSCSADFYKIYNAMRHNYPRTAGFPSAGFVAGPCLFKDTMQLAAFNNNNFFLGHSAMLVNEGLPNFIVTQLKARYNLREFSVGILGMAFKANSDDGRDSLSYKLRRILEFEAGGVVCSDPYVADAAFVTPQELFATCRVVILGAPHSVYSELTIPDGVEMVDVWNFYGKADSK